MQYTMTYHHNDYIILHDLMFCPLFYLLFVGWARVHS